MNILFLNVLSANDRFPYEQLAELASDSGIHIDYVREQGESLKDTQEAWKELGKRLNESDSFILSYSDVLRVPVFIEAIHKRIEHGARLFICLNENDIDIQNAFLAWYDLGSTRIRIRSRITPTIEFSRSADSFRDFRLFSEVEKVTVQQPNAIWHGGDSLPILVGADEGLVSDGETDFPADWNTRELACIAGWQSENGGGVIAVTGNYFGDPYVGATGVEWPGIEVNKQFAKNLLRYLSEGMPADSPYGMVSRIEANLGDFVLNRLRKDKPDWWTELVPEKIRIKCE